MTSALPILLADDEESDIVLLQYALAQAGIPNPVIVTRDGKEAVDYLSACGRKEKRPDHPLPGLFLLDLKMPIMTGFEVLAWMAARSEMSSLPVVVLTSSIYEADETKARQLGAADYRVKPCSPRDLVELLEELHARWLVGEPGEPMSAQAGASQTSNR